MNIKKVLLKIAAATSMAVLLFPIAASAVDMTKVVSPANMQGWAFFQEIPNGSGALVNGPETPPLGNGSAQLTVDSTGRELLLNNDFADTDLANITELTYSTFRQTGSDPLAISLQLDIDTDGTDANTAWQGRLVYEPYFTHTVVADEWQTWNTMDNAVGGNWWFSGAPGNTICPQANPCTWSEVLAAFSNAEIRDNNGTDTAGFINFKAGGPWAPGFVGNVDAFTIGVSGNETTYNFEQQVPSPTSRDDCKDGGWMQYNNPSFRNQGQCVASVNRNNNSTTNRNNVTIRNNSNQTASTGNATSSNNTIGGSATSGNAGNNNTTTNNVRIRN